MVRGAQATPCPVPTQARGGLSECPPRRPARRNREEVKEVMSEEPVVLTVEEAARVLRIGRSAAYEQARRYLATGGAEGLPVIRFGRRMRVPRQALSRLLSLSGLRSADAEE